VGHRASSPPVLLIQRWDYPTNADRSLAAAALTATPSNMAFSEHRVIRCGSRHPGRPIQLPVGSKRFRSVVGSSYPGPSFPALRAFLWTEDSGMADLGTLGGTNSSAVAINAHGQVVGSSNVAGDVASHATLWNTSPDDPFTLLSPLMDHVRDLRLRRRGETILLATLSIARGSRRSQSTQRCGSDSSAERVHPRRAQDATPRYRRPTARASDASGADRCRSNNCWPGREKRMALTERTGFLGPPRP
jgi:probable HAF family extracellular repeat protein